MFNFHSAPQQLSTELVARYKRDSATWKSILVSVLSDH